MVKPKLLVAKAVLLTLIACNSLTKTSELKPVKVEQMPSPSPINHATLSPPLKQIDTSALKPKREKYPRQPLDLVDKARPGSDFYQFRERLRQAVRERNARFIRSITTPDIRLSFGKNSSTISDINLENPNEPIWPKMEKALSTGCYRKNGRHEAWGCPHVSSVWHEHLEPSDYVAIAGERVNVYSQPSINSPIVDILSNEAVKKDRDSFPRSDLNNPNLWTAIILPNGSRVYIQNRYVYDPIGYRAFFHKGKGGWMMNAFIAGD
jgi:hypothetical protein